MKPSFKIDIIKPVSGTEERPSSVWHSSLCYPGKTTYGGAMSHSRSYSRSRAHSRMEPYPLRQKVNAKPAGKAVGQSERMMTIMNMLSDSQDYSRLPGTSLTQELSDLRQKLGYGSVKSPLDVKKERTGPPTHKLQFLHENAEDKRGMFLSTIKDIHAISPISRASPVSMFTGNNIKENIMSGEKKVVTTPHIFNIQSSHRKTEGRNGSTKTEDRNIPQPKYGLKFSFSRPDLALHDSEKTVPGLGRKCDNQSFTFSSPITLDEYTKNLHHA